MSLLLQRKTSEVSDVRCADLAKLGERELAAVFRAVTELFGAEQAQLSAEEWLHELSEGGGVLSSGREFRAITTKVLVRLAKRLRHSSFITEAQIA